MEQNDMKERKQNKNLDNSSSSQKIVIKRNNDSI